MSCNFDVVAELKRQLELPVVPWDDQIGDCDNYFDPWEIFPCFYGSYCSDFDDMAIEVLEAIQNKTYSLGHEPLSHRMFREVLCNLDLCDYGTSPRVCFPNWSVGFGDMLPLLIEKWKQYRDAAWSKGGCG